MSRLNLNIFVMAALGSVLLLLLSQGVRGSPVATAQEPIRCAPCSPERIASCPAVDPSCEEVLREPGCGCCMACALKAGVSCGSHTASCGSGLRCLPKPGETRPLHALLRGQGICTEKPDTDTERNQTPQTAGMFHFQSMAARFLWGSCRFTFDNHRHPPKDTNWKCDFVIQYCLCVHLYYAYIFTVFMRMCIQ